MKRQWLIAVVVLICVGAVAGSAIAGHPGRGHGFSGRHADHLIKELNLQGAQAEQVREIFTAADGTMQELHERLRTEMCALHTATLQQLSEVLNEDQQAQLDSLREERRARIAEHRAMKEGKGQRGHGPRALFASCDE